MYEMVFLKNKIKFALVFFALAFSLSFSLQWILPLSHQLQNEDFHYTPIKYAYQQNTSDDYYYYSYIRDFIDKDFWPTDPLLYEDSGEIGSHYTFYFSYIFAAIGGMITEKTSHAFYFNNIFYPFITLFITYCFVFLLTKNKIAALLIAVVAIATVPSLERVPNIMITNIPLSLTFILFFDKLVNQNSTLLKDIFLIILVGLSPLTSFANGVMTYGFFFFVLLFYGYDSKFKKNLFIIAGLSFIVSIPGFYVFIKAYLNAFAGEQTLYFGVLLLHREAFQFLVGFMLKYYVLILLPLALIDFRHKKFIVVSIFAILTTGLFVCVVQNTFLAIEIFIRGCLLAFRVLVMGGIFMAVSQILSDGFIKIKFFKINHQISLPFSALFSMLTKRTVILSSLALIVSLLFTVSHIRHSYSLASERWGSWQDKDYKELYEWAEDHTGKNDVLLTLDFYLLTNISDVVPANIYLPQAILSPALEPERLLRFYETVKFYGVEPDQLREMLSQLRDHAEMNFIEKPTDQQYLLMDLVLYYSKPMTASEKSQIVDKLVGEYKEHLEISKGLSYRATHLVMSKFGKEYLNKVSAAEKIVSNQQPVFDNGMYQVYLITN